MLSQFRFSVLKSTNAEPCSILFSLILSHLTLIMQEYISAQIYENRVSKHFIISLNWPCLSLFTGVVCLCVSFFCCFVIRALCRSGCRQNFANFYLTPPSLPPSLPLCLFVCLFFFSSLPTILCSLMNTSGSKI